MEYKVSDLVKIAEAEIGYKEKATNSQLDSKTANAGSNNYTKYGRDLYAAGYYNGNKNGIAWCDQFYDWCVYQLAGKNKKIAEGIQYQTGDCGAGCKYSAQYYRKAGKFFTSKPQVGDQIFFGKVGAETHTGMVVEVDATTIKTIEGNSGNMVKKLIYNINNSNIAGYGRPNLKYNIATTTTPVNKTPTTSVGKLIIPTPVYKNGAQINLNNVPLYKDSSTTKVSSRKTGKFYIWSTKAVKGRIRITTAAAYAGKLLKVTGWIDEKVAKANLFQPFKVKIICKSLNVRASTGTNYNVTQVLTTGNIVEIVEISGTWGKLSTGKGWIYLDKSYVANV